MRKLIAILLAATILTSCSDKVDDDILVSNGLPIEGTQEVPPKQLAGNGTIDATYNRNIKTLYYTVKWHSLTGAPTTGFGIYGSAGKGSRAPGILQAFDKWPAAAAGTYSSTVFIDGTVLKEEDLLAIAQFLHPKVALVPAANTEVRTDGRLIDGDFVVKRQSLRRQIGKVNGPAGPALEIVVAANC